MAIKKRIAAFIDGFNLYHAIADLRQDHLKWVNLSALVSQFIDPSQHSISAVHYFSAFADHHPERAARHREYVEWLVATGVRPVMGYFKPKEQECLNCGNKWPIHKEKETDVNISISMLNEAYKNSFDTIFLISGDSDLAPPLRMIREQFPDKTIKLIAPPGRRHSKELVQAATGIGGNSHHKRIAKIQEIHIQRSLFPSRIVVDGVVRHRPMQYDPPRQPVMA